MIGETALPQGVGWRAIQPRNRPVKTLKLRLINICLSLIGAAIVSFCAAQLPWATPLLMLWTVLPLIAVLPVVLLADKPWQQAGCILLNLASTLLASSVALSLSNHPDAFVLYQAWLFPAVHLAVVIAALLMLGLSPVIFKLVPAIERWSNRP